MTTTRDFVAAIASALLILSSAEKRAVSDPDAVDASALGAAVRANAIELLVGAAEAGNTEAMNVLGVLYAIGSQVPRDYPTALYWFQSAIDRRLERRDVLRSRRIWSAPRFCARRQRQAAGSSAAHGNVHSMYSAAVMAEEVSGTSRDPKLARTMYRQAAKSGVVPADEKSGVGDDYSRWRGQRARPRRGIRLARARVAGECAGRDSDQALGQDRHALGSGLPADRRDAARMRAMQLAEVLLKRSAGASGDVELGPQLRLAP